MANKEEKASELLSNVVNQCWEMIDEYETEHSEPPFYTKEAFVATYRLFISAMFNEIFKTAEYDNSSDEEKDKIIKAFAAEMILITRKFTGINIMELWT